MPKATPPGKTEGQATESCFVIMPYGGWFDEYYETIYKPAILAAGLKPRRADDLYRPGTIIDDIWKMAQLAQVVLADLTDRNPNVFYELGLAHAIAKPIVMVVDSVDEVPFDLRGLRIIVYDKNRPNWSNVLQEDIQQALRELAEEPLAGVPATFMKVREEGRDVMQVSQHDKDVFELRQDLENLRKEFRSHGTSGRDMLTASQAKTLLESYVRDGMSQAEIMHKLVPRDVPESMIRREVKRLRSQ